MTKQESPEQIPGEQPAVASPKRRKTSFAGDVLKLVTGTTFAQFLVILAAPILTRLYAPDAFGVLALFASITSILGVIACLRYELAIMLPEKDEEAANLLGVSLTFVVIVSLLTVPLVWWGKDPVIRWLNAPGLASYLWLVPVMVFIHGVFLALNYWNSRTKHFGRLSIARVTSSLTTTTGKLGVGFMGYATAGTIIGATVAGQAVATSVLGGQIWRDDRKMFFKSIRWKEMRKGIVRHKKFPLLSSWSAFMNTTSSHLPPLMLAMFFSPVVVGFFALGHRLLSMPMNFIGSAIAQVFYQRASAAKYDGTYDSIVRNAFTKLLTLGLFPILLVMIAGKDLFSFFFGSQWSEAGVYAQILAPWIMFQFISSPISTLFSVLEMQGQGLVFNSLLLATRIASLMVGGLLNSILIALMLYSITGSIMYFSICLFILKKSGLNLSMLVKNIFPICIIVFLALLPVVIMRGFGVQPITTVAGGCISMLLYYVVIYFHDRDLRRLVSRILVHHSM
ncbi:MAG TPA: oligosaccharide flippase family protein [Deltaproteobacteria bacterium]|nr:oligosaccharide flippase family protein [Deltaproteobacteria bacterium]